MKRDLLNVIFASDKRKDTLLLLKSNPQKMESLLSSLDTTRQSLIPQIRILEEHHLLKHQKNKYELTQLGKVVVDKMSPLLDTVDTFGSELEYWGDHILDFIPSHLLGRMKELGKCDMIVPSIQESHEVIKKFHESSKKSGVVYSINTFFYPNFEYLFEDLVQNNVEIHYILSQELLNKMKDSHHRLFAKLIDTDSFYFYIHPESLGFMSLGLNDQYLMVATLRKDGNFDNKQILCGSPSAVKWGKELFNHYMKGSTRINEI